MPLIPCVHDSLGKFSPSSGFDGNVLIIRTCYQPLDRLVYHHCDGLVVNTAYLPTTSSLRTSDPINPFCIECKTDFIRYLIQNLGYPSSMAYDTHSDLCDTVLNKITTTFNRRGHQHCQGKIDAVDFHMGKLDEHHSCDPLEYFAWVVREIEAARPKQDARKTIEGLEKVEFKEAVGSGLRAENCAVCLDVLGAETTQEQALLLKLPCGHVFHGACVAEWLLFSSNICPLCRYELPVAN